MGLFVVIAVLFLRECGVIFVVFVKIWWMGGEECERATKSAANGGGVARVEHGGQRTADSSKRRMADGDRQPAADNRTADDLDAVAVVRSHLPL